MNATFAKVLGLVLVLALMLSGCNLIEIDAKMQADEDIAKIQKAYARAVANYEGGEVTIAEAMGDFNESYNEMAYMYYYYFGTDISHEQVHTLAEEALSARVRSEITAARFDEAHTLTDEEIAEMETEIQSVYDSYFDSALEVAEGKDENAKREHARVLLQESGVDYDAIYDSMQLGVKQAKMEDILRGEISEVSEEELRAAYEEKIADQEYAFTDGYSFEDAMSGEDTLVCWRPDGYRTVKHILVMPSDEVKSAYSDAVFALEASLSDIDYLESDLLNVNEENMTEDGRSAEDIRAEISAIEAMLGDLEAAVEAAEQACLEDTKAVTDEIYSRLNAGESFEALIAEYGEDPGMQTEPTMSRGYYVSLESENWEDNFRDAAMALDQVGAYSAEPVVSGSGVHIIQYTADVLGGPVDLEEVREALTAETLQGLQEEHMESTISAWIEAVNPTYDVEGFEAAYGAGY